MSTDELDSKQFTTIELEYLCEYPHLPAKDADILQIKAANMAEKTRLRLAADLADRFENGDDYTTRDRWAAFKHRKTVNPIAATPPRKYYFLSTEAFYRVLVRIYTGIRLFAGRIGRFFSHKEVNILFLPPYFVYLGLANGLFFLIDLVMVLKNTFFGKDKSSIAGKGFKNSAKRAQRRFINALTKGSRPYRMLNDSVWVGLSIASIVLAVGASAANPAGLILGFYLAMAGFLFDTLHEFGWLCVHYYRHIKLEKKLLGMQQKLKADLMHNPNDFSKNLMKIRELQCHRNQVQKSRKEIVGTQIYVTGMTILISIAMTMVSFAGIVALIGGFPPAAALAIFFAGSAGALLFGSILMGPGRQIALSIKAMWKDIKKSNKPAEENTPTVVSVVNNNPSQYSTKKMTADMQQQYISKPVENADEPQLPPRPARKRRAKLPKSICVSASTPGLSSLAGESLTVSSDNIARASSNNLLESETANDYTSALSQVDEREVQASDSNIHVLTKSGANLYKTASSRALAPDQGPLTRLTQTAAAV